MIPASRARRAADGQYHAIDDAPRGGARLGPCIDRQRRQKLLVKEFEVVEIPAPGEEQVVDGSLPRLGPLDEIFGGMVRTLYSTVQAIESEAAQAHGVIGAIPSWSVSAPRLIDRAALDSLPERAVLVDAAIDQTGLIVHAGDVTCASAADSLGPSCTPAHHGWVACR